MPATTTRQIGGVLLRPDAVPFANVSLTIFRDPRAAVGQGGAVVVDQVLTTQTGPEGEVSMALLPGKYLGQVRLTDTDRYFQFAVPDTSGPFLIGDLLTVTDVSGGVFMTLQDLAILARAWAENPEDEPVLTDPDQFSAKHHAAKSAASAGAAASSAGLANSEADRAETARDDAQGVLPDRLRRDVATLLADTALTYTASQPATVTAGDIIRTRAEGFAYEVAASGATDHHRTTAGGVKLYYRPTLEGVHLRALGITTDGVADSTAQLRQAVKIAASLGFTNPITTKREYHPPIILPAGRIRFTEAGTLTDGFTGTPNKAGLRFLGQGINNTHLIYDNTTDVAASSHAADGSRLEGLAFENMKIEVRNGKRFILWQNAGGGGGALLYHHRVEIAGGTGGYDRYLDIAGGTLGSETMWEECRGTVPADGTLFYVSETNPQSVNHNFRNCSFASFSTGTVFRFRAGGNLRWLGGYGSFGDGSKFLVVDPPSGGLVGQSNWDFTFIGWHPEIISDANGDVRIVEATRGAQVNFISCNLNLLRNVNGFAQFWARQSAQETVALSFTNSWLSGSIRFDLRGRSDVFLDNSHHPNWNTMVVTYDRLESSNFLSPVIRVSNPKASNVLPADPFLAERDANGVVRPIHNPGAVNLKCAILKHGTSGNNGGLIVGLGSNYTSFEGVIPLGSIIKSVTLVYMGPDPNSSSGTSFKVTNHDESVTFIPEFTMPFPATARRVEASASPLMVMCDTPDNCKIKVWGKIAAGTTGALGPRGYVLVEYY